ncbi:MAG: sugar transferase [Bacteroidales bacterium]|nr:sugar transferase [Bacteroidales bacterium]MBD5206208.1 sugar transferase [Bacteroidales bacterium]MBD5223477.1 sugar transferase [Bacteroidales bacterium]MBD5303035.1 sugar transferase [Bacteroides sp.]
MNDQKPDNESFKISPVDDGNPIANRMNLFERFVKKFFDVSFSGILLIVFSPLFFACYIAVRLEDGGKAIYKQKRIGLNGKPFDIFKFRSMKLDAEKDGPQLYKSEGDDPRLTKVGKFLREHHLDELPQLWNVFRGDMSFIGPRPEREFYIKQIMAVDPRYKYLYQIRPGVTSYATLYNGYTDTLDKMVTRLHYDLYYLQNASLKQDMKILWLTFSNIVGGKKF